MMNKTYRTIRENASVEIIINKSRFIGQCFQVSEEAQAQKILEAIRKRYWDATHNCFAYSIGDMGTCARYSDDGEPGGTAGLPMMEAVKQKGLTNLLVVVTRYFGGILLGAGGLVRAYSRTASEAMEAAGIVEMRPCVRYSVPMEYTRWGVMEGMLREQGALEDISYTDIVTAKVLIEEANRERFEQKVIERTDGRVKPVPEEGTVFGAFEV